MKITVTWGTGTGTTKLSAFDRALWEAGIANMNLIPLSSIIPPNSEIEVKKLEPTNSTENFGKRVYVVLSSLSTEKIEKSVYAGVGWVIDKNDRKGLFVEHYGNSEEEAEKLILDTLTDMVKYREDEYGEIEYKICGIECKNKPVAALVWQYIKLNPGKLFLCPNFLKLKPR